MATARFSKLILLIVVFLVIPITTQNNAIAPFTVDNFEVTSKLDLPKELNETSGLLYVDSLVLTFNDSGNKPVLYGLKTNSAEVKYRWNIANVKNNDWEDIAQDSNYIYIGDFGNNFGKRKDLAIYKIKKKNLFQSTNNPIIAETINFSFEDQTDFTPSFFQHSFDCEAMICLEDSIFIFSKDWKNLKTTSYVLPKIPGTHIAEKCQTFDTEGLVTGADYNKDENILIFTGYVNFQPFIWIFKDFNGSDFFSSEKIKYELTQFSGIQNEGICFYTENKVFMSSEKKNGPATLFNIEISDLK